MRSKTTDLNITHMKEIKDDSNNEITYNKIVLENEPDSYDSRIVVKKKSFYKSLKEIMNLPLLSGIFSILISSLPFIGTYLGNKDSVVYKLIIGKKLFD